MFDHEKDDHVTEFTENAGDGDGTYNAILYFLRTQADKIAMDLHQAITQQTRTTKQNRREKALAYLLEAFTGHACYPRRTKNLAMLELIQAAKNNAYTEESKIGLDRAEARLMKILDTNLHDGKNECKGCGEWIVIGQPHECENKSAKAKDAFYAKDPDIVL